MKVCNAQLKSSTPFSMSKHHSTPYLTRGSESLGKETKIESHNDYEQRTWRERCHVNEDDYLFIPPTMFKNSLAGAAKYLSLSIPGKGKSNYTKHFEAGVMVMEGIVLPIKKEDVKREELFVPSDGRRGGSSRVTKNFPLIHNWEGSVDYIILDEIIPVDVFEQVLRESGSLIGIGRFRPRNNGWYGRFDVMKTKWSER